LNNPTRDEQAVGEPGLQRIFYRKEAKSAKKISKKLRVLGDFVVQIGILGREHISPTNCY
jgi:hypothetical protein